MEVRLTWIMGVDAGGSKCAAVALNEAGEACGAGRSGPGNPNGVGVRAAAEAVWESCLEAMVRASWNRIDALGVGFAGGGSPQARQQMREALEGLAGAVRIEVFTDLECGLAGAFEGEAGVMLVAGTGSSAIAGDGSGRTQRAGGLGPRLGDEGSGYWIATRSLALALSGAEAASKSVRAFFREHLEAPSDADLANAFHRAADQPARIAALAAKLFEACGDHPLVQAVLTSAARHLVELVLRCGGALDLPRVPVACVGGLLQESSPLRAHFARALAEHTPHYEISAARRSPEWGAAHLVAREIKRD